MKLSVIVATYNQPDYLTRVLDGLLLQKTPPHEILVADDGSGPETAAVVHAAAAKSPVRVIHVRQEDRGFRLARIRNKAIRRSTGDYLVMLDGDSVPDPYFVNDHLRLAEKGCFFQGKRLLIGQEASRDFTAGRIGTLSGRIGLLFRRDTGNRHHLIRLTGAPSFRSRSLSGVRGCNMGFFRADLAAVNGFNEDFEGWGREDSELAVRLFRHGLRKKTHPFMAICYHLWHASEDRSRLSANDDLLAKAMASDEWVCKNGLLKIDGPPKLHSKIY